jgi:hypothetical protein
MANWVIPLVFAVLKVPNAVPKEPVDVKSVAWLKPFSARLTATGAIAVLAVTPEAL